MSTPLQKFTTEYQAQEDRIRLLCALPGEQALTLWMTLRLLQRLVVPLCQWLQAQPVADMPAASSARTQPSSAVHAMAQQLAQSALAAQTHTPVSVRTSQVQRLVCAVQAQGQGGQLQLTFQTAALEGATLATGSGVGPDARPQAYTMAFTPTSLHQWLGILYQHASHAQWPLQAWPQWFSAATSLDLVVPGAMLH